MQFFGDPTKLFAKPEMIVFTSGIMSHSQGLERGRASRFRHGVVLLSDEKNGFHGLKMLTWVFANLAAVFEIVHVSLKSLIQPLVKGLVTQRASKRNVRQSA